MKKAGLTDAVGLVEGLYPGAAAAGFRNFPESTTIDGAADRRGLHEGHAHARAARPRGADRRAATRPVPVLRNVEGGSLAARLLYPEVRQTRPRRCPISPVIGTDAPEQYEQRDDIGSAPQAASGRDRPDARGATVADPRAIRVRARDQRRRRDRVAAAARPRGAHHRRRPQPAADDEAPAREPGAPDRHQRPRRSSPTSASRTARSGSAR